MDILIDEDNEAIDISVEEDDEIIDISIEETSDAADVSFDDNDESIDVIINNSDETIDITVEKDDVEDISVEIEVDFLKGEKGESGPSNVLTIGIVEPGEEARAYITGESPNQILNLVLPKGDKGKDGEAGSNDYNDLKNKPDIPTKTSNLENDSGFITKNDIPEIPDTSEFIKNTVDNLVNYYLKSETYSKEEIDELANDIASAGYATEKWVKDQNYMPIEDFHDYMQFLYYTKNEIYNKEEIDNKLSNLPEPSVPLEFDIDANIVEEDGIVRVYTNTGYEVSDKDIRMQPITEINTTGTNKIVYTDNEVIIIYDGRNKIRRSENGFKFDIITLPCACKSLAYNHDAKRLYGTDGNNYFIYSEDDGLTWKRISNTQAKNIDFLDIGYGTGFRAINKAAKKIIGLSFNSAGSIAMNTSITSTIIPNFIAMVNNTQFVWCNSSGTFKYGAGSQEGAFASLTGISVNMLKRVNNITFLGLKNSNKFYILESAMSIRDYKWVEYTLPNDCTVNDIIFNLYDETYYIFTDVNTYYKTKDFIEFENIDNRLKGLQGHFTLMGIQMTTNEHDFLLLAPTRKTVEEKLQEIRRALNKDRWVGPGLERVGKEQIGVKGNGYINVNTNGVSLIQIDEHILHEDIIEGIYAGKAEEKGPFDPYEIENWYYGEDGYPQESMYKVVKFIFNQDGSFINMVTWEEEYTVEQYDYGYLFIDQNMNIFKYVKLGNKSWMFNKGE